MSSHCLATLAEIAQKYRVTGATVRKWCKLRMVPHHKICGTFRFNLQAVEAWFEEKTFRAPHPDVRYEPRNKRRKLGRGTSTTRAHGKVSP